MSSFARLGDYVLRIAMLGLTADPSSSVLSAY